MDRSVQEVLGTHQLDHLHVGRQRLAQLLQIAVDLGDNFVRVGSGRLVDHTGRTGRSVHRTGVGVALRPQLDRRNVLQPEHPAVVIGTDHDLLELLFSLQTSAVLERVLVDVSGILADRTGRRLDILAGKGRLHIRRFQLVLGHYVGFEPDTHRIVAPHDVDLADARDTLQLGLHIDAQVIGQKSLVIGSVRAVEGEHLQGTALTFHRLDPDFGHLGRQQRRGGRDFVLHVDGRHVGVTALLEIDRNLGTPRVAGRGGHVDHVLHAVDRLLERHDHTLLHRLGIRTAVCGRHADGRRGDVGILLHGEGIQADQPGHQDYDRNDDRQNRSVYESLQFHATPPRFWPTRLRHRP